MDFVNKAYAAILDLFKSMTPAARVTSGLLLVAIVVSTMYLFQGSIGSVRTSLFPGGGDLRNEDIMRIEQAFSQAKLNDYEIRGNQILVPLSQRSSYWKAIADNNALPANARESGYTPSLFENRSTAEYKQRLAKQRDLQSAIQSLESVYRADVSLDEVRSGPMQELMRTCSVIAKPSYGGRLSEATMKQIVGIVRGSVSNIDPRNITVTDASSQNSLSGDILSSGGEGSLFAMRKREAENLYRQKIRTALLSYGDIQVGVEVDLSDTVEQVKWEKNLSTTAVPLKQNSSKTVISNRGGGTAGAPGTRSQQAGASANGGAVASSGTSMNKEVTEENTQSATGGDIVKTKSAGFVPKMVTATIGVSAESVKQEFLKQNPPAAGEEDKPVDPVKLAAFFEKNFRIKIQEKVARIIPVKSLNGQTTKDNIYVSMDYEIPVEPDPGTPITTVAVGWISNNWQSIGLMFFGVFAIVALRSMVTSAINDTQPGDEAEREFGDILPPPVAPEDQEIVVQRADGSTTIVKRSELEDQSGEDSIEKANRLLDRFQNRQPTLREELTELVEADLDAAATVLKAWIGDP